MRIGLLSDTHSYLDPQIFTYLESCNEVWHAGDVGSMEVIEKLQKYKRFRGVYGNIDDKQIRQELPEHLRFTTEGVDVWMTHIGGYPGRYDTRVRQQLFVNPPDLFICGHSHILKVIYDKKLECLHMNPGACGRVGLQKVRTMLRFSLDAGQIKNAEIIHLGNK